MAYITLADVQAWCDTKLPLGSVDSNLEGQMSSQVLSRIARMFDTSGWTDNTTTPTIIRSIIAMKYVSWMYSKYFSEDQVGTNEYALRLDQMAETLIAGILDGTVDVPGGGDPTGYGVAEYYPNDLSSAQEPTSDDPSLGGARFTMGVIF